MENVKFDLYLVRKGSDDPYYILKKVIIFRGDRMYTIYSGK